MNKEMLTELSAWTVYGHKRHATQIHRWHGHTHWRCPPKNV